MTDRFSNFADLAEHYAREIATPDYARAFMEQTEMAKLSIEHEPSSVEMPDPDADRIIASLRSNGWAVSGKLRRDQPDIFAPEGRLYHLQDAIVEAVKDAMTRHGMPVS